MGAIKDLLDITTQLLNSVEDRRIATELTKIHSLISSLLSDHFDARERNVQLLAENARLQQALSDLEREHAQEVAAIHDEQSERERQTKEPRVFFPDDK